MPDKRSIIAQTTPGDGTVPTYEARDQDGVFQCAYMDLVAMLAHLVEEGENRIIIHDGERGFGMVILSAYIPEDATETRIE